MNEEVLVKAFNEWMRRFIDEPERYYREFEEVIEFISEEKEGVEPSYGQKCAPYLIKLMQEV